MKYICPSLQRFNCKIKKLSKSQFVIFHDFRGFLWFLGKLHFLLMHDFSWFLWHKTDKTSVKHEPPAKSHRKRRSWDKMPMMGPTLGTKLRMKQSTPKTTARRETASGQHNFGKQRYFLKRKKCDLMLGSKKNVKDCHNHNALGEIHLRLQTHRGGFRKCSFKKA